VAQQPLGLQTLFQIDVKGRHDLARMAVEGGALTKAALERTLHALEPRLRGHKRPASHPEITEVDVGEGCVLLSALAGGSVVVVWDGRGHIDVNLFLYAEDVQLAGEFVGVFKRRLPVHKVVLHDMQPRGYGGVVNFRSDLKLSGDADLATASLTKRTVRVVPAWAYDLVQS